MAKLWGGRFRKNTNELVDAFNASINYDKRLYREDIRGSIAHATMLARQGIISVEDKDKMSRACRTSWPISRRGSSNSGWTWKISI